MDRDDGLTAVVVDFGFKRWEFLARIEPTATGAQFLPVGEARCTIIGWRGEKIWLRAEPKRAKALARTKEGD